MENFTTWLQSWKNGLDLRPPLLVILGPTASGKTALSLELAHALNGEIISADSRQIYKEIDIGSDKLPLDENRCHDGIPHHLIDFVPPDEVYTMGDFKRDAERIIGEIHTRGHMPMLVGGTGLYIRAIVENFELPTGQPNLEIRQRYQSLIQEKGNEYVYKILVEKDPAAAATIHPNNTPYVLRALEIVETTGAPKRAQKGESKYNVFSLGIEWPREEIYRRIDERVDLQFKRGLVEESKLLIEKYGMDSRLPSLTSLGLKEFAPYLSGSVSLESVAQKIKSATRQYAKRQITWFSKDKNVHWIKSGELETSLHAILHACPSLENAGL